MYRNLKYSWLALLIFFISMIPAQKATAEPVSCRYVTRAEVLFQHDRWEEIRLYLKPEKISSLLTWLRLTKPQAGLSVDQQPESDHRYRITLHYSDGSQCICRLYGYSLLSRDDQVWQAVLPVHAQLLYPLFYYLPSDIEIPAYRAIARSA